MKKLLFIIILGITTAGFSQNKEEKKLSELLCRTWKLNYGTINGNKIGGLEVVTDKFIFSSNKTYKLFSSDSTSIDGIWKYNLITKFVELSSAEDGRSTGIIKSVNENELILIPANKSFPKEWNAEFIFKADE